MKRIALLGGVSLVAGFGIAVALLVSFPAMMFGGCTDVGVPAGEGQGASVVGVADGNLLYTPDGANECSIPLPVVLLPTGLIAVGTGLVLSQRVTNN